MFELLSRFGHHRRIFLPLGALPWVVYEFQVECLFLLVVHPHVNYDKYVNFKHRLLSNRFWASLSMRHRIPVISSISMDLPLVRRRLKGEKGKSIMFFSGVLVISESEKIVEKLRKIATSMFRCYWRGRSDGISSVQSFQCTSAKLVSSEYCNRQFKSDEYHSFSTFYKGNHLEGIEYTFSFVFEYKVNNTIVRARMNFIAFNVLQANIASDFSLLNVTVSFKFMMHCIADCQEKEIVKLKNSSATKSDPIVINYNGLEHIHNASLNGIILCLLMNRVFWNSLL